MKTGLSALIHPASLEEYLHSYEKNEPFFIKPNQKNIKSITELPFLSSLEDLLKIWPSVIQAHLPDVRDESSSVDTNVKDALKLFNNGMGLLFNEAQTLSPMLVEWLEKIRQDLGLSALTYGRCLIYATPDGKGSSPHFDQNINFVLQIQGTKKWIMAPNVHVSNPMTRHTMGQPTDPELESYLHSPMPMDFPKDSLVFELTPGSLLFVPRGYWHATEAAGDALSLNFTFTAPTWIDLFTAALRSRLAQSPDWRETANGVSDHNRFELAESKFDSLLAELIHDLPNWKAADILGATEAL